MELNKEITPKQYKFLKLKWLLVIILKKNKTNLKNQKQTLLMSNKIKVL